MMNGKLIAKSRNFWLIVEEYGEEDGIVVLNKITDHGGKIPYDSIRKWQDPNMVILSAQVNVGKDGLFELNQFLDGPETEMMTEEEEILPERLNFVETALRQCPRVHPSPQGTSDKRDHGAGRDRWLLCYQWHSDGS